MSKPKVISQWRKFYNNKMINIVVKHSDWWYQAFIDDNQSQGQKSCVKNWKIFYMAMDVRKGIKEVLCTRKMSI